MKIVAMKSLIFLCMLAVCGSLASCKPTSEKKDRVHHSVDLGERDHEDQKGYQFDHEAFLGKETAKTFDQLTPEESKERLGHTKELMVLLCHGAVRDKPQQKPPSLSRLPLQRQIAAGNTSR
eukprot:g33721.t1